MKILFLDKYSPHAWILAKTDATMDDWNNLYSWKRYHAGRAIKSWRLANVDGTVVREVTVS
jgi:hypothetical protein